MYRKEFYSLLVLALFLYLLLRAVFNPLVFDEATTFLLYARSNNFLPWKAYWAANNHYLNTALVWGFTIVFGPAEFVQRIPNLLAFLIFSLYLYRLALPIKSTLFFWGLVFATLFTHPFLELFGFSRGYGLSFAFLAAALYYMKMLLHEITLKRVLLLNLMLMLIIFSNLSLLPIVLLLYFGAGIWIFISKSPVKVLAIHALIGVLPIIFAVLVSFELKERALLFYSTSAGFWDGSLLSLQKAIFHSEHVAVKMWFLINLVALLIALRVYVRAEQFQFFSFPVLLALLVLVVPAFYFIAHFIIGVEFPLARSIIFLPFLFALSLIYIFNELKINRKLAIAAVGVLVFPLAMSFGWSANFKNATAFLWNTEQIPDAFFEHISKDVSVEKPTIAGYFLRQQNWDYLNFKSEIKTNRLQIQDYPSAVADYQIVDFEQVSGLQNLYDEILTDHGSGLILMKRKKPLKRKLITEANVGPINSSPQYYKLLELLQPTISAHYYFECDLNLSSLANPFHGVISLNVVDSNGITIDYLETRLYTMYPALGQIKTGLYISDIPHNAVKVTCFLYNVNQQEYELESGHVSLYELEN